MDTCTTTPPIMQPQGWDMHRCTRHLARSSRAENLLDVLAKTSSYLMEAPFPSDLGTFGAHFPEPSPVSAISTAYDEVVRLQSCTASSESVHKVMSGQRIASARTVHKRSLAFSYGRRGGGPRLGALGGLGRRTRNRHLHVHVKSGCEISPAAVWWRSSFIATQRF